MDKKVLDAYAEYQKALANPKHPMHQYIPLIRKVAAENKVPEAYMVATLFNESRFDPKAVPKDKDGKPYAWDAHVGRGIAQFTPSTGRGYGLTVTEKQDDRLDPNLAIPAMGRFAADNYKRANGDIGTMVNLYYSGRKVVPQKYGDSAQKYRDLTSMIVNGYTPPTEQAARAKLNPTSNPFYDSMLGGTTSAAKLQPEVTFDLYKDAGVKPDPSVTMPASKYVPFADLLRQSYGYFGEKPLI